MSPHAGVVVGGYLADVVVQRLGLHARLWVLAVTQVRTYRVFQK
jgi:hypothetical protein